MNGAVRNEHVAILLATKDGHRFLGEQLESFASQSHQNWSLHVSDDGSSDGTRDVLARFADTNSNQITVREGPQDGFWQNFMSLAQDQSLNADYFAFSDQDDVWYADKLTRALGYLRAVPGTTPAVYCSRTELVDEHGQHVGYSPLFDKPPSFRNALVQNIGGGNTMVFNAAAKRLLQASANVEVVSHDWWLYLAVSAVGGAIFYDPKPSIKYRQHVDNIVGSNAGIHARLSRLRMMFAGRMTAWNETNLKALRSIQSRFHESNLETLATFAAARAAPWFPARLYLLYRSGVYRQAALAQIGLVVAACLRKL